MSTFALRRSPLSFALVAATLALAACGGTVVVDGSGDDDPDCGPGTRCGDIDDPPIAEPHPEKPATTALAFYNGNHPMGFTYLPGDYLVLEVASQGITCEDPSISWGKCERAWQLTIALPPWLQEVGVYSLDYDDSGIEMFASEQGQNEGSNDCWGGGGNYIGGNLEIFSISEDGVRFRLDGTWIPEAVGQHMALQCL